MKKCNKCGITKEYSEFYVNSAYKDGYLNQCKGCKRDYSSFYREENKNIISEKNKISTRNWRLKNKHKHKENSKKWREKNKDKVKEYYKYYYDKNKDRITKYRNDNKEYYKSYNSIYYIENKSQLRLENDIYKRNKKSIDPLFRLSENIRSLIYNSFNRFGKSKSKKTQDILGCSFEEFKIYLESKFEDWMNWDNRGLYNGESKYGWDIDHIIPISSAKTEEEVILLNHYTNLQPLCSKFNRNIKKNKIEDEIEVY